MSEAIYDWDPAELDDLDYTPAPREHTAQFTRWMLARLCGDELKHYPSRGTGECEECDRHRFARFAFGTYTLCFNCLNRRIHVNTKLERGDYREITRPLADDEAKPLELARQLHQPDDQADAA